MTQEKARRAAMLCSSYSRLSTIIEAYETGLTPVETLAVLGEFWTICDNIGEYQEELEELLPDGPAPSMMTGEELEALAALPKRVTLYRGADRGVNEWGLSWSRERDVASRFPFLMRYRATSPVLITGVVDRRRIVAVKLGRDEFEVIVKPLWVRVVRTDVLTAPPAVPG